MMTNELLLTSGIALLAIFNIGQCIQGARTIGTPNSIANAALLGIYLGIASTITIIGYYAIAQSDALDYALWVVQGWL